MNKMAEVAALYGKKLEEEFEVFCEDIGFYWVKFTEKGLKTLKYQGGEVITRQNFDEYQDCCVGLDELLAGVWELTETWEAKE